MHRRLPTSRLLSRTLCAVALLGPAALRAESEPTAQPELKPLWEAGLGVAAIDFPDYRGSDERRAYVLPAPYLVYRGDFLRADEQRVRGMFFESPRAEVDVSISGTVPVDSSKNRARRGMPDLDATLEIGPSLNLFLYRPQDRKHVVELRLPVRAVLASDFSHVDHEGWVFQPHLNLDVKDVLGYNGWNFGILTGPLFADRRYHQYVYGVDRAFATADRPAYQARGGYAGAQLIAALSKRFPKYWVGGFAKYDTVRGAVFEDSPLVKRKHNFTAGFAISWILGQSSTLVEPKD